MATATKKQAAKKRHKRKTVDKTQSKARSSKVKRAALLKRLSVKGGRKRATAKRRLEKSGATGDEW